MSTYWMALPEECNGIPDGHGGFTIPLRDECQAGTDPSLAGQAAAGVVGQWMDGITRWVQTAMTNVATSVASFWTSTPTVSVGDATGTPSDSVGFLRDSLGLYTALIAVASLIVGGIFLAVQQRPAGLAQLGLFLVRIALAGTLITAVSALLIAAMDSFSEWVIPAANNGTDLGANLALIFANPVTGPVGLLCMLIMFLSSVWLVAMMWIRSAMLVLIVGTIGLAAALWTPTYFARQCKMLVAVILVKPLAALVFAVGFRLMGSNVAAAGVTELVVGAVILLTACWSWKFLVKVIAPYDDPMPQTGMGGAIARTAALVALIAR